ncbi:MAG: hypothetical protein R6U84_10155, partial [Candidatus Cloacimonadales bacterium]
VTIFFIFTSLNILFFSLHSASCFSRLYFFADFPFGVRCNFIYFSSKFPKKQFRASSSEAIECSKPPLAKVVTPHGGGGGLARSLLALNKA